jgi:hypothetical protein
MEYVKPTVVAKAEKIVDLTEYVSCPQDAAACQPR